MLRSPRTILALAALAACATVAAYALAGWHRPPAQWKLINIASEASLALMACAWFVMVLGSRAPGRITTLLACGLGGLMLGATAGCMDELVVVAKGQQWNYWLGSALTLAGMASLTWGLYFWRGEQLLLTDHLQKRERLFRDHRSFDQLTKVGDADYLREQLRIEHQRGGQNCCLLMLDIDSFHLVNRDFGQREGDRVLQAVTQVLLLNLRSTDLLCRYAGDRFAILLPNTQADVAHALADQLRRAVASLRHHAKLSGRAITPSVRYTFRNVDAEPRQLLKELNRALERRMPSAPYGQVLPAGATASA